jgi:hypothetical protein
VRLDEHPELAHGKGSFTTQPLFSNATGTCVQTYP